jgi:hypothetical protein
MAEERKRFAMFWLSKWIFGYVHHLDCCDVYAFVKTYKFEHLKHV